MDTHAGATECQCSLEFTFGDLRTQSKTDSVIHGSLIDIRRNVGDGPPTILKVLLHGLLQRETSEVGADDNVLASYGLHYFFLPARRPLKGFLPLSSFMLITNSRTPPQMRGR